MEPLLSFDVSAIDVVLIIAVIILLLLYITRTPSESAAQPKPSRERNEPSDESTNGIEELGISRKRVPSRVSSREGSFECLHRFGYLKTLSLGSSVPEECYGCTRMMQCLFSSSSE